MAGTAQHRPFPAPRFPRLRPPVFRPPSARLPPSPSTDPRGRTAVLKPTPYRERRFSSPPISKNAGYQAHSFRRAAVPQPNPFGLAGPGRGGRQVSGRGCGYGCWCRRGCRRRRGCWRGEGAGEGEGKGQGVCASVCVNVFARADDPWHAGTPPGRKPAEESATGQARPHLPPPTLLAAVRTGSRPASREDS